MAITLDGHMLPLGEVDYARQDLSSLELEEYRE